MHRPALHLLLCVNVCCVSFWAPRVWSCVPFSDMTLCLMLRYMSTLGASPFSANNTARGPTPRVCCVCAVCITVLDCAPVLCGVSHWLCQWVTAAVSCGVCQRRCWEMLCHCVCVFLCTCCVCVAMRVPGVPAVCGCCTWCSGGACRSEAAVHVLLVRTLHLGIGVHVACVPSAP